jgi:hypothetical protein
MTPHLFFEAYGNGFFGELIHENSGEITAEKTSAYGIV